jgi:hypothetical protein
MALTVDYLYQFCLTLIKKNQSGGLKSTDFSNHWNGAQNGYFSDLIGRFQSRNNGRSRMNAGLIQNEVILTKLLPFTKLSSLTITNGSANKPSDFYYTLSLRIGNYKVYQYDKDQLWAVLDDVIDPPSIPNGTYYYTEYQNYYTFLPVGVTSCNLDYIAVPQDVLWAYTFDATGRQNYDPNNSVQPLWDSISAREITERCLKTIGVAFASQDFENFGQSVIQTGN